MRFRLRLAPPPLPASIAVGWICTAKTALHCEHCTDVMPSGSLTCRCWAQLGHEGTITYAPFPEADPQYLVEENATYVVQVNGKFRGKYDLPKGQTKDSLLDAVQKDEKLVSYMSGEIVKVIFVPDKLINVVVKA